MASFAETINEFRARIVALEGQLRRVRAKLEEAVCTEGCDKGVVLLSEHGPTHEELWDGKPVQVYDHEYFSPLGDALIAAWEAAAPVD
jgi:hypothetical protein